MNTMHQLDALILRNAIRHLEQALDYMKEGGFRAELLASLDVTWAVLDLKRVLGDPAP